jgi:type I restriction enzyme M protein
VLRLDPAAVDPYYLADYLRQGFGKEQINRLYTGSTRLIELTPEHVDRIIISLDRSIEEQKRLSDTLRQLEAKFRNRIEHADSELNNARQEFALETARLSS